MLDTYVLRHAWLNLSSEHITAGRINQESSGSRGIDPETRPVNSTQPHGRGIDEGGSSDTAGIGIVSVASSNRTLSFRKIPVLDGS